LGENVGVVDRGLHDLLLFGIEILREVLVQSGLFLLEFCT
jgi:hypothetical protein